MKAFLLFCFFSIVFTAHAQTHKDPYKFSYQIDSIYRMDSDDQDAGVRYSRIGDYRKALDFFSFYYKDTMRRVKLDDKDIAAFKSYHAVSAAKYILDRAKETRIIILNEAHHIPAHRAFVESLLPGLRQQGYNVLGMETFNDHDTTINTTGYPVLNSGAYSVDPCYGDMIRKGLSLGYRLFGYETDNGSGAQREVDEANNIARNMQLHPDSKYIFFCGYDHLLKDTMTGKDSWGHAMAGWLRLKGIEALTIDQTILTATGVDSLDNPYRRLIHQDKSVVMISDSGKNLKPKKRYNADISVYHPDTRYIHGRPEWQIGADRHTENINNKIKISFPVLSLVYRKGENDKIAVPTDVIEIKSKDQDVDVILEKKYKNVIILKNPKGERQVIEE